MSDEYIKKVDKLQSELMVACNYRNPKAKEQYSLFVRSLAKISTSVLGEGRMRLHSLWQYQPGLNKYIDNNTSTKECDLEWALYYEHSDLWSFDDEIHERPRFEDQYLECMIYDRDNKLIASFRLNPIHRFGISSCDRTQITFKFYAKNCDDKNIWNDASCINNALNSNALNYYNPTRWDINNNYFISLEPAISLDDKSNIGDLYHNEWEDVVYSYPDNLPYVECVFYLNQEEFEMILTNILEKGIKQPSNFLIKQIPSELIQYLSDKLQATTSVGQLGDDVYNMISHFMIYDHLVNTCSENDLLSKFDDRLGINTTDESIFKANFNDPFPTLYKERYYETSRFWVLQTLIMKRDALDKIIFKDIKEYYEFECDLYKSNDFYESKHLFNKKFLKSFFKKIALSGV